MRPNRSKIVVVGEMLVDWISGRYETNLSRVKSFRRHFGGSPANIAVNLNQLGIEPALVTRVGADPFGAFLENQLREAGVSLRHVQRDPIHPTSMVFVCKSRSSPSFFPIRGADQYLEQPESMEELLDSASYMHLSAWPISHPHARKTVEAMIDMARQKGVLIGFDPNYRKVLWEQGHEAIEYIRNLLSKVHLCKPSEDDSGYLFGIQEPYSAIRIFHELGARQVVFSMGAKGALVSEGGVIKELPPQARVVVDTTGAGDGFWSGLYAGLSTGKNLWESACLGNAIAAFRVERIGTDDVLPAMNGWID